MLEKQSRNSKAEDGAFTHILLLNCEGQRSTTTYYSKKTNKQELYAGGEGAATCAAHFTYNIIHEEAVKQFEVWCRL